MVTIDFETFYDSKTGYTLRSMTTEEYVFDPRFRILMVSVKRGDEPAQIFSSDKKNPDDYYREVLGFLSGEIVVAHNMMFDGLILARLGIYPKFFMDTLSLARLVDGHLHASLSLAACLSRRPHLNYVKGAEVGNMDGIRYLDAYQRDRYAAYCNNDCDSTYALLRDLTKSELVTRNELEVIDLTMRMYCQPQLQLDTEALEHIVERGEKERELALSTAAATLGIKSDDVLMLVNSNAKFPKLLTALGVEVPQKLSLTTPGKLIPALAKTDEGWIEMLNTYEEHPVVGPILLARTGVKSSINARRAERLLVCARVSDGWFRVPLKYFAAHTGRYGGTEKVNAQNFPRVSKKLPMPQLRQTIKAPPGMVVLAGDLSQIEARLNAYLSGEEELVAAFALGQDIYLLFASKLYGRTLTKEANPTERFVGKTCILGLGYGMGHEKLRVSLLKDGIILKVGEAEWFVKVYRNTYQRIAGFWERCEMAMIKTLKTGDPIMVGKLLFLNNQIILPTGGRLVYPDLMHTFDPVNQRMQLTYTYQGRYHRTLWGGKIAENVMQTVARGIIMDSMVRAYKKHSLRPALQAHDELVYVVPESEAPEYASKLLACLTERPNWAPDLPLAAEVNYGPTYGDTK